MITIIIPTYNRAYIIHRSLDSVMNQTFKEWECIVVDDYSTDNTKELVEEYIKKDSRYRYILNERKKGAQGARNTGVAHARGEWVTMLDSDDFLLPSYLERVKEKILDGFNGVICCYGQIIEEETSTPKDFLNTIYSEDLFRDLLKGNAYVTFQFTTTKKYLYRIGMLDEECPSHQELDTHIRLSKLCKYEVIPEVQWHYYVGRSDTISVNKEKHIAGQIYIMKKYIFAYRRYAYKHSLSKARILWDSLEGELQLKNKYRKKLLILFPELPLVMLKRKIENYYRHRNILNKNS